MSVEALFGVAQSRLDRVFRLMEIAEQELDAGGRPQGMFLALAPRQSMYGMLDEVYRAHCRELIRRHGRGQDLAPGTDAEVLVALSETSIKFPFNQAGMRAVLDVGSRVLSPDVVRRVIAPDGHEPREAYEGEVAELISGVRRHAGIPGRRAGMAEVSA